MADVVVDTHVLLWWFAEQDLLSRAARRAIDQADRIMIAAISFWEIEMLRSKQRVELDRPTLRWRRDLLRAERFVELPLTGDLGVRAAALPEFHGDPADRQIVAATMAHGDRLVTKDGRIRSWGAKHGLDTIW